MLTVHPSVRRSRAPLIPLRPPRRVDLALEHRAARGRALGGLRLLRSTLAAAQVAPVARSDGVGGGRDLGRQEVMLVGSLAGLMIRIGLDVRRTDRSRGCVRSLHRCDQHGVEHAHRVLGDVVRLLRPTVPQLLQHPGGRRHRRDHCGIEAVLGCEQLVPPRPRLGFGALGLVHPGAGGLDGCQHLLAGVQQEGLGLTTGGTDELVGLGTSVAMEGGDLLLCRVDEGLRILPGLVPHLRRCIARRREDQGHLVTEGGVLVGRLLVVVKPSIMRHTWSGRHPLTDLERQGPDDERRPPAPAGTGSLEPMRFAAPDLAVATGGRQSGPDVEVQGVSIDSRTLRPGELFVPVPGERDGHLFIPAARAAGAPAYLTGCAPLDGDLGSAIIVDDTVAALQAIGRLARARTRAAVVGITGSVGKTSTKDLLANILRRAGSTTASFGSFNNELGLPLTLANAHEDDRFIVAEMGARHRGNIAELCQIARPSVGIVTTIGTSHIGEFGDIATIVSTKGELVEALPADGSAILNADDPQVASMASRSAAPTTTFGCVADAHVRAAAIELDEAAHARFRLHVHDHAVDIRAPVPGRHHVVNVLAAAAAASALAVPLDTIAAAIEQARSSRGRMHARQTGSGATIVDDSYNASPQSLHAAIAAVAAMPARRRFAVLGSMAEQGAAHADEHRRVVEHLTAEGFRLVAFETDSYDVAPALDVGAVLRSLGPLDEGDVVLVKGSRVHRMERIVDELHAPSLRT